MYHYKTDTARIIDLVDSNPTSSWEKLTNVLNGEFGEETSANAWRKRTKRAREMLAMSRLEISNPEQRRAITLERQYLRFERTKNYEAIRDLTLRSMFIDEVKEAIKQSTKEVKFNEDYNASVVDDEFVFVTADFHYDGNVDDLNYFNKVYNHIIEQQKIHKFNRIKLIELGDTIDGGSLRTSQLMAIKKGMVAQIIDVSKVYGKLIEELAKKMFVEFYCITSSNHTQLRPLGTKQNELVEEDLMLVFAEYIFALLSKNENVKVFGASEYVIQIAKKFNMFVAHGHLVKDKEGYIQKWAFKNGLPISYGLFGHYHHYREITLYDGGTHNRKVFYSPAMTIRETNYEKDKNLSSKAGMLMMVFNEQRGHRYCEELFL